eukprot:1162153-Pelagomonas_calceolata.AAC.1
MHTGVGYEECVGEGAANESTTFWIRTTYDAQLLGLRESFSGSLFVWGGASEGLVNSGSLFVWEGALEGNMRYG